MSQDQLLEYIIVNNPEAVSQRLGVIGLTDGEYYGPEELHDGIIKIATDNMDNKGGDASAYWDTVANAVDVPLNPNGPYAAELQQALNSSVTASNRNDFNRVGVTVVKIGITRADIIDWLIILALVLMIGQTLFGRKGQY